MSILKCPYCSDSIRKSGAFIVGIAHTITPLHRPNARRAGDIWPSADLPASTLALCVDHARSGARPGDFGRATARL